jgi:hypothetical protein
VWAARLDPQRPQQPLDRDPGENYEGFDTISARCSHRTSLSEFCCAEPGGPKMIICEFCLQYTKNDECAFGLRIPKRMGCREFDPGIGKFCSDPNDFVSPSQIIQMATFFGIKGTELKKVKAIAAQEGNTRLEVPAPQTDSLAVNES